MTGHVTRALAIPQPGDGRNRRRGTTQAQLGRLATFVGRDEELAVLGEALRRAAAGQPQLVWIEADAGMGKTALLHQAGLLGEPPDDLPCVVAKADITEASLRWGVASELLAGAARLRARSNRVRDADHLPLDPPHEPGGARRRSISPSGAEPVAVGAELLAMFDELQRRPPGIVVIEDIHWCDLPTAQALLFALRRLHATEQLLVVLTTRPGAPDHLGEGWQRLRDDARTTTIVLDGLSAPHLVELASVLGVGTLPTPVAERLAVHTAGHPLYARSVLEDVPLDVLAQPSVTLPVPRSLGTVFLARLGQLAKPAQSLVVASAVVGRPVPLGILREIARTPPDDEHSPVPSPSRADRAIQASRGRHQDLDEVLESGLLVTRPDGLVGCSHPLVQAAVVGDLPAARLAELHRRAAAVLDGTERLVHLVAALDAPDPTLAAELRARAAHRRQSGAYDEAADLLLLAAAASDSADADAATLEAAEALVAGGDRIRAASLTNQIAAAAPSARRDYLLGCGAFIHGHSEEARHHLRAALAQAHSDPASGAMAATTLALADLGRGDATSVVALGRQAVELAGQDPERSAGATTVLAMGLAIAGRHLEATDVLRQWLTDHSQPDHQQPPHPPDTLTPAAGPADGVAPSRRAGPSAAGHDPKPLVLDLPLHTPGVLDLLVTKGIVELAAGWARPAAMTLRQAATVMRRGSPGTLGVQALAYLAETELRIGRWDDAQVHAELAVSVGHDTESVWSYGAAHAMVARIAAWRGDQAAADEHQRLAQEAVRRYPSWSATAWAAAATATARFLGGDPAAAVDALEPAFEPPTGTCLEGIGPEPWLALRADAQVAAGQLDGAADTLDRLASRITERRHHHLDAAQSEVDLHRLWAVLADKRADRPTAEAAVDHALQRRDHATDCPLAVARLELTAGQLLRRWRRHDEAVALLRSARRRFEHLGCLPLLGEADAELRHCGVPSLGMRQAVDLTPRERAVAHLAASGYTNRDIASELFVSVKAVEYHLGNVYAKLGIRTRRQLRGVLGPTSTSTADAGQDARSNGNGEDGATHESGPLT